MQIHELTQKKKLKEGIITDPIRAAGQAIKTGYQQGGLKGAAGAAVDPTAYYQAKQNVQGADAAKAYSKLKAKGAGTPSAVSMSQSIATAQKNPQLQQYITTLAQKWAQVSPKGPAVSAPVPSTLPKGNTIPASANGAQKVPAGAEQKPSAGAGAFGNMVNTITRPPGNTPTSGAEQKPSAGAGAFGNMVNTIKTPQTNQQATAPASPVAAPAPKTRAKYGVAPKISPAANPGTPTPAEYEKFQQRIASATNKPTVKEAFNDLPGGTNTTQSQYLKAFKTWVEQTIKMPLATLEKDPILGKQLKAVQGQLVSAHGRDDAAAQKAFVDYMTLALAGVQNIEANKSQDQSANATMSTSPVGAVSDKLTGVIDSRQLTQIAGVLKSSGGTGLLKDTGNPAVNDFLKSMGFRI